MKARSGWIFWLAIPLALGLFGCGDDNKGDDGDPIFDGDVETDGDQTPADGDAESTPDGDEEEATPPSHLITGTLFLTTELAAYDRTVFLYTKDNNPFLVSTAEPAAQADIPGGEGTEQLDYTFRDVEDGIYYVMLTIDVGNDDSKGNDVIAVHPVPVPVISPVDGNGADTSVVRGINIYAGVQNEAWGYISGNLHVLPDYQREEIVLVAARQTPEGAVEFWPVAADFSAAAEGTETRPFNLRNLTDGTYYLIAFVMDGTQNPPVHVYPCPYTVRTCIGVEQCTPDMNFTDRSFFVGMADTTLGSVSGALRLSGAVPGGQAGVYLYSYTDRVKPISLTLVEKTDTDTEYTYEINNLCNGLELYIVGGFQPDESSGYTKTDGLISVVPHAEKITIDTSGPSTQNYTVDFDIPISELTGVATLNLAVATKDEPAATLNARFFLLDGAGKVGAMADVTLGAVTGEAREGEFFAFPVLSGTWIPVLVLDENGNGFLAPDGLSGDPQDKWCSKPNPEAADLVTLDGTQQKIELSSGLVFNYSECVIPGEVTAR